VEELFGGVMPRDLVEAYFSGEPDRIKTVDVVIRPKVHVARSEHSKQRNDGIPEIVTPLITPAVLARDGRLYPRAGTVVPRDLLEPLERDSLAIGSVFSLDTFLTTDGVPGIENDEEEESLEPEEFEAGWASYRAGCGRMLEKVCAGQLADGEIFETADYAFLLKKESITGASRHILALYDHARSHSPKAPLFDRYASEAIDATEPCLPAHALFSARLGHASDAYPLAPAQRDALSHLLVARHGEILAVNGPPGTGKTTLLLSVVASLWAKAALEEAEPPLILAASTNNQAVTNIIDAFGRDFAPGTGALAGHWLPCVKSFGAYFPSAARESEGVVGGQYQTRGFFDRVESASYVAEAEKHYLQAAVGTFPDLQQPDVQAVVTRLHQCLQSEVHKLSAIEAARKGLTEARDAVCAELGDDPRAASAERVRRGEMLEADKRTCDTLAERWETYLAQESIFYSLFAWLPPVARKRLRLAKLFLKQVWPNDVPQENWEKVEQIETAIESLVARRSDALRRQQLLIQRAESVLAAEQKRLQAWDLKTGQKVWAYKTLGCYR
jgi:hypothetical protein